MANSRTTVELVPSAKRLVHSLRDIGYDFEHAVADLVDNSITAQATTVNITMQFEGKDSWLRIADNGTGMSGTMITEAMRFGTEREYESDEMGRFGLGLKTASLSQCRKFTVASRVDPNAKRIEARQWDLSHLESTNRWEVINVSASERCAELVEPLQNRCGTVVFWEQLDRVLGYKDPWGAMAQAGFNALAQKLDSHLAMVFHRFLSGKARRRKALRITVNDTVVEPWDPFAREEPETIEFDEQQFEVNSDEGPGLVGYKAFILPPQGSFSSQTMFNYYAGPNKWNRQQGFYVYRCDRMIQSGGWSRMRTADEHTKLARVALDFRPDLDSAFKLNVSKTSVILPSDLREHLKPRVNDLTKQAGRIYRGESGRERRNAGAPAGGAAGDIAGSDEGVGSSDEPRDSGSGDPVGPRPVGVARPEGSESRRLTHIGEAIENAAEESGQKPALKRIKQALRQSNREVADDIGW